MRENCTSGLEGGGAEPNRPSLPLSKTAGQTRPSGLRSIGTGPMPVPIRPEVLRNVELDYLGILFRWMHILAAVTAVGGTIFVRVALLPSIAVLPDDQRKALHEQVRSRWIKFVMGAILFLLASGFYNIIMKEKPPGVTALYHALFGIKFLLALVIFFVASALVGRSPALAGIRANARFWLTLNMVLAITVVCISGVLRALPPGSKPARPAAVGPEASPSEFALRR